MNTTKLANHAVGIDIGTSRIVIAVVKKGGVEIISNECTYRQTPTLVTYGEERQMGDTAKNKIKKNLKNSVFSANRFLGRMTPENLRKEKQFNFSQIELQKNQAQFKISYEGVKIDLSSE